MTTENILYLKNESEEEVNNEDDVWDDQALVQAYDRAVELAKKKIAAKLDAEKPFIETENGVSEEKMPERFFQPDSKKPKWRVGMHCRALYSSDLQEYEAVIKSIDLENGTCVVKFVGYSNEEEVQLSILQPSHGKQAQHSQKLQAKQEQQQRNFNFEPQPMADVDFKLPPPPPPFVISNQPKDETDALSAMLMSWYMCGYHTGYYQGISSGSKPTNRQFNFHSGH